MKRFLAFLLITAIIIGLFPAVYATEAKSASPSLTEEDYVLADLMWEGVNATEERMQSKKATAKQTVEAIVAEVTSSPYYAKDSLIRNGEHIFWETTDGIPCGYSPRLSEKAATVTTAEGYDSATAETVLTTSYSTKGNSPGNRDVFLIQPYYGIDSSFTTQYVTEANSIAKALGGTATTYRTTAATIDAIADSIEAGAVVIFDSHGDTDYAKGEDYVSKANTSYICLQTNTGITTEDYRIANGPFGSYYHAYYAGSYGSMKYYCVDGTAIANHLERNSQNGLLWMAICLSMATDGLQAPLRSKGIEVAYGYSQSVTFEYDYDWEEAFWGQILLGKTVAEAVAYMKNKIGLWDWCHASNYDTIAEARAMYCAFPIVVSSEDVYPGHGNVDDLQTVRSTWTLKPGCFHENVSFRPYSSPNCTEEGNTAYYACTNCGAFFTDAALMNRVTAEDVTLPPTGHSYDNGRITTPATCTADGILTYSCEKCGHSYTEPLLSVGHDFVEDICTLCGLQKPLVTEFNPGMSGTFVIAAKVNGQYLALPNTYTNTSGKMNPIIVDAAPGYVEKGLSSQVALELTYDETTGKYTIFNGSYYLRYPSSTNLGGSITPYYWTVEAGKNGTWRFISETSTRGLIYRASGYNYFGGYYIPNVTAGGREYFDVEVLPIGDPIPVEPIEPTPGDPTAPALDENIQIGHTLNLASDISINYAVKSALLEGYDSFYLSCEIPVYEGTEQIATETVTLEPVLNGSYYYFTLTGITAVHMGNEIQSILYMTKGEETYRSNTDVYSVATYAYAQLAKENIPETLKKLCAELLRYGAAAQTFKGYRVEALVDRQLTDEQRAYLTDPETVTFNQNNSILDDVVSPPVIWAGKTLNLESKVVVKFIADLSGYTGDPANLQLYYSYENHRGETVTGVISDAKVYHQARNYYSFDLDTLLAADLRCVITAAVYSDGEQVSPTTLFSPDAYAVGRTGTLLDLCRALMSYSDTALAYFTKY